MQKNKDGESLRQAARHTFGVSYFVPWSSVMDVLYESTRLPEIQKITHAIFARKWMIALIRFERQIT